MEWPIGMRGMSEVGHVLCRALELEVEGQRKSWKIKWI